MSLKISCKFKQRAFGIYDDFDVLRCISSADVTWVDAFELGIAVVKIHFDFSCDKKLSLVCEDPAAVLIACANAEMYKIS